MKHSFDVELALSVGVCAAIVHENIKILCELQTSQNSFYSEWGYCPSPVLRHLLPYFTNRKIYQLLNELEQKGYIESTVKNKSIYDNTKSYRIINTELPK